MFQSKEIARLTAELAAVQAELSEAKASLITVTTERDQAVARVSALEQEHAAKISEITTQHAEALETKEAECKTRLAQGVVDELAISGVPESSLPAHAKQGAATTYAEAIQHYQTLTDAKERADYYASTIAPLVRRN